MNVYDFDQTIYHGDSTVDFYLYCVRHRPLMIYSWPGTAAAFVLYQAKIINKTQFKRQMYQFLRAVGDTEQLVEKFWDSHINKIKSWYTQDTQREDDVIISASPEFLLRPACRRLGIAGARKKFAASVRNSETHRLRPFIPTRCRILRSRKSRKKRGLFAATSALIGMNGRAKRRKNKHTQTCLLPDAEGMFCYIPAHNGLTTRKISGILHRD